MKFGVIGCGYVFDHYMTTYGRHPSVEFAGVTDRNADRARRVGGYYGLKVYPDTDALLSDPGIEAVANFTSIPSHYAVSKAALEAGKHVYSEKPLTPDLSEARALADLAAARGLHLSCAPSNALSASVQTLWKIVEDGALGDVRLVYAEFDDNPVYLLNPETWASRSGAPWPYLHEYEMGCTWEHAGYHLGWMCAIFGPVAQVTAFSKHTLPDKTEKPLDPADTPDFSVAVLEFESGVVGRLTCSIAAPTDHRMRIIGNRGVAECDTYRHYDAPVRLEPFHPLSLKARNLRAVRTNTVLQRLFGVGGRRVPLAPPVHRGTGQAASGGLKGWLKRIKADQYGVQDKCAGLAELASAVAEGRTPFPTPEFTLHITELTLAIQAAGPSGHSQRLQTRFAPLALPESTAGGVPDYNRFATPGAVPRLLARFGGGTP